MDGTASEFKNYQSGIINPDCKFVNHIVTAYGVGTDSQIDFYNVKNRCLLGNECQFQNPV